MRALRLSSRPPKAGSPLPAELAARLTEATTAALTSDTGPDRFATVLDALAFSPVRTQVVPTGIPAEPGDALLAAVRKLASRVPQIAALFGIEAVAPAARARAPAARAVVRGPAAAPGAGARRRHPLRPADARRRRRRAAPEAEAAAPAAAEAGSRCAGSR